MLILYLRRICHINGATCTVFKITSNAISFSVAISLYIRVRFALSRANEGALFWLATAGWGAKKYFPGKKISRVLCYSGVAYAGYYNTSL